jgi:hypothetical protein
MSFGSWFKNLFHHVNPHNLAGALAAGKATIDQLAVIEKWDWVSQFDTAASTAITGLNNWTEGSSTTEISQALNTAVGILNGVQGLSPKDKEVISVFVVAAESALAFLG